jgi:hypothetical protein
VSEFKTGDRVWWDDPDDGACSGPHTIAHAVKGDEIISITPDGKGVTEVFANELTPLNKYRVHGYCVVRVVLEVEGKDQIHAIDRYEHEFRPGMVFGKDAEFADEIDAFLVDEDGDTEYNNSQFYCSDGKTIALNRCTGCLRDQKTGKKPEEEKSEDG